jgi:heptosyltransferase-2
MRLLFIRFSSIGDIVLTSPTIRCAKKQIPGVEIHFLTKASMKDLVIANPYIDQVHFLKDTIAETVAPLQKIGFDYIIDLHHNQRTWRIKNALGVKAFSYQKLSIQKWLLAVTKINWLPKTHVCNRYLNTLSHFGVVNDGAGLDYFIPPITRSVNADLPPEFDKGYTAFVIGASYETKKMPLFKWKELCEKINSPIVIIGDHADYENAKDLATAFPHKIFNACGKYTLSESAVLIRHANKVVSHDTGFLHIATAFNKPTVTIWGATSPVLQFEAYYASNSEVQRTNAIVPNLGCQPCSKQGGHRCPKVHFKCMMDQNTSLIAQMINKD